MCTYCLMIGCVSGCTVVLPLNTVSHVSVRTCGNCLDKNKKKKKCGHTVVLLKCTLCPRTLHRNATTEVQIVCLQIVWMLTKRSQCCLFISSSSRGPDSRRHTFIYIYVLYAHKMLHLNELCMFLVDTKNL